MQSYLFIEAHCRNYNGRWNTIFMLQVTEQHFLHITNINITLFHAAEQGMEYSHGFTRFFFAISSIVFSNWIKVREGYFFDSNSCSTKIVLFYILFSSNFRQYFKWFSFHNFEERLYSIFVTWHNYISN